MNNRVIMPTQDASLRKSNFNEVALGYSKEDAMNEASRCLRCKTKPCVSGCPVNINIPEFIQKIKEDNIDEAAKIINEASLFGKICGRVCPQECQCEAKCVRGIKGEAIAIGNLERFVSDNAHPIIPTPKKANGKKVAIVGSGPSGLACAYDLAKEGCSVTIYESLHATGGVLRYGIPEFRLPKAIVDDEVNKLKALNVNIYTNKVVGKTIFMEELQKEYDAIYVASGAGLPKFMGIEGENLNGVYSANEFLTRINLMKAYDASPTPIYHAKNVCVVGGGNVAMDAARCALRLNPENVYIVYRRSQKEMPARLEEIHHAQEEGIIFKMLTNPVKILGDDNFQVKGIECIQMELGAPDASGRRSPVEIKGSNFVLDVDCVIMALGNNPNPILTSSFPALQTEKHGCIVVNEEQKTSIDGIYAGGDIATGAATVILAMGAGKKAASSILNYLKTH